MVHNLILSEIMANNQRINFFFLFLLLLSPLSPCPLPHPTHHVSARSFATACDYVPSLISWKLRFTDMKQYRTLILVWKHKETRKKVFFSCAITVQKAFICISRDLNIALQLDGTIVSYYLSLGFYLFGNGIVASSLLISSLPNTYILIILLTGGHLTSSTWYCKEKVFVARPSSSSGSENCNWRSFHFFFFPDL